MYLDNIIIWSQSLEEHKQNVRAVLDTLQQATLFCSPKKTSLFCLEVDFLGHHISAHGVEADLKKVAKILDWPQPKTAMEARQFLGLVCYLADHLPDLARYTSILNA